eukprot:scaffold82652_cov24-Tisochrysis_lutea.AAC.2
MQAARKFTEVSVELGTTFNNVIAPQDVALYGVLCALASFERSELQQRVMANIGFKEFMELTPEVGLPDKGALTNCVNPRPDKLA